MYLEQWITVAALVPKQCADKQSPNSVYKQSCIDPLQLHHSFLAFLYAKACTAILVYHHTLATYAISIKMQLSSLIGIYTSSL